MKSYSVIFTKNFEYEVEAENENDAENLAYEKFASDMRSPVASTWYDECDIECLDEDEDEYLED